MVFLSISSRGFFFPSLSFSSFLPSSLPFSCYSFMPAFLGYKRGTGQFDQIREQITCSICTVQITDCLKEEIGIGIGKQGILSSLFF